MKSYSHLLRVTARILRWLQTHSFSSNVLSVKCVKEAETYWLKQSMQRTREALEKGHLKSLRPSEDSDGIIGRVRIHPDGSSQHNELSEIDKDYLYPGNENPVSMVNYFEIKLGCKFDLKWYVPNYNVSCHLLK